MAVTLIHFEPQKEVEGQLLFWKDVFMEWMSKAIDKLPPWQR